MTITVDLGEGSAGSTWSMPSSAPNQIVHFSSGSRLGSGEVTATFVADCSRAGDDPGCVIPALLTQMRYSPHISGRSTSPWSPDLPS